MMMMEPFTGRHKGSLCLFLCSLFHCTHRRTEMLEVTSRQQSAVLPLGDGDAANRQTLSDVLRVALWQEGGGCDLCGDTACV